MQVFKVRFLVLDLVAINCDDYSTLGMFDLSSGELVFQVSAQHGTSLYACMYVCMYDVLCVSRIAAADKVGSLCAGPALHSVHNQRACDRLRHVWHSRYESII